MSSKNVYYIVIRNELISSSTFLRYNDTETLNQKLFCDRQNARG